MRSFLSKALPTMMAALFSAVTLVSAENNVAYDQGYEVDESQLKGVYNASASVDVSSSWDFYANASFIYWFAKQQGLEAGIMRPIDATLNNYTVINFPFEYKPGFKVGIGTHFDYDDWNVYAQYTRLLFRNDHYVVAPSDSYNIVSLWNASFSLSDPTLYMSDLRARWKLNHNVVDLECARPYYVGKKLSFSPHAGLRGGWINQRYIVSGAVPLYNFTYESFNKSNSWLTGVKAGLDANWIIGGGFRFLGNAAGSLCYQHFDIHQVVDRFVTSSGPASTHTFIRNFEKKEGQITPNLEGSLGMGWDTYLDNKNWHFDITAAYEFSYFWNQNKMRGLKDSSSSFVESNAGDLMLHGLTINARMDF